MTYTHRLKDKPRQIRRTDQLDVSAARSASARQSPVSTYPTHGPLRMVVGPTRWDQLLKEQ